MVVWIFQGCSDFHFLTLGREDGRNGGVQHSPFLGVPCIPKAVGGCFFDLLVAEDSFPVVCVSSTFEARVNDHVHCRDSSDGLSKPGATAAIPLVPEWALILGESRFEVGNSVIRGVIE